MRKDVGSKIERQRGGHPKLFTNLEKRCCVTLVNEDPLGITSQTTKQLRFEEVIIL